MDHTYYMSQALELAAKGWPAVQPNPLVGCVIVRDDKIVSGGYHQNFGGPHAEVHAVESLPPHIAPDECTVYVTLEPCSHHGKTPPCADLLISKGFKKVIIASKDPNPLVSGRGIRRLTEAGIEVESGVLKKEAEFMNRKFFRFHESKRPYITLKWALTADNFISREPLPADRSQNKITRQQTDEMVHRLRAENMAIMVGKNTVLADDPALTVRYVQGRHPVRVIIDHDLSIPAGKAVFAANSAVLVFNNKKEGTQGHVRYILLKNKKDELSEICHSLYQLQIQSLMVEGGARLLQSFIDQNLWDEALVFQNPDLYFTKGLKGPEFPLKNSFDLIGEDKLFHHFRDESLPAKGPLAREIF